MADKNEAGGGVVPSAFAELRRASKDELSGLMAYVIAILFLTAAVLVIALFV